MIQNHQLAQLNAELRALREENAEQRRLLEQARDALEDAAADIADWASYASDQMRGKHNLYSDVKLARDASQAITQHLKGKP